jgi:hypothetical protein
MEPLGQHDRAGFLCGSAPLDHYFEQQVSQDIRRRITACYVAVCNASNQIAGFYTLSAAQIFVTQYRIVSKRICPAIFLYRRSGSQDLQSI